jgi:hypothetical protein
MAMMFVKGAGRAAAYRFDRAIPILLCVLIHPTLRIEIKPGRHVKVRDVDSETSSALSSAPFYASISLLVASSQKRCIEEESTDAYAAEHSDPT